jgi:MFS family permease
MPNAPESSPPLSSWRYVVVLMTMLAALWMYIDRNCFSTLAGSIQSSLRIGPESGDFILGAFFFSYGLLQVPAGALSDRFGPRLTLAACITGWSAATMGTALAWGPSSLFAARLILGAAEAGAYPAAVALVARWAQPNERGAFSGIISFGGRIGGAVAPTLATFIAIGLSFGAEEKNWRAVFLIFGALGLVVAAGFWAIVRDRPPSGHQPLTEKSVVETERKLETTSAPVSAMRPESGAIGLILRSPNMWLSGATQLGINLGWAFLVTKFPGFLEGAYHVPLAEQGWMQTVPLLVGCVGMLVGGFLTDWLRAPLGPRWCRSAPIGGALLLGALAFSVMPFLTTAWSVVIALSFVTLLVDLGVPAIWAFNQDVGGRNVGTVFGWGNMWGNLAGAAFSPVLLGWVSRSFGWGAAFGTCSVAFAMAGVCGLLMNASKPLEPPVVTMPLPPE